MSEALDRLDRRIAWVRRATLICAASLAAATVALASTLAPQTRDLMSARRRLDQQVAQQRRLIRSVAQMPRPMASNAVRGRLAPDATFVVLAGHVGTLARSTGNTVRMLKRIESTTQDNELHAPAGEAEVAAQLELDTTYWSGLEFLRALDGLTLPVVPTQLDLESPSGASPGGEPRLVLRLQLLAYGMMPKRGG